MAVFTLVCRPSLINRLLFLIMCICAWWALTYHQELVAATLDAKILWSRLRHLLLPFLTVLWLMLTLELTGLGHSVSRRMWACLFVIPVLTVLLAWTLPHHALFRHSHSLPAGDPVLQPLLFERGYWSQVYDLFQLALQGWGVFLLLRVWRRGPRLMRKPVAWLLFSSLFPIIANLIFNTGAIPTGGLNPAPLLLFPAAAALAFAMFRLQLLNVAPVARDMLFDLIRDGILVTDADGCVADLNQAATRILGLPAAAVLRQPVGSLPEPWASALDAHDEPTRPVSAAAEHDGPWFERSRIPIQMSDVTRGWMFLLQDVTAQTILHRARLDKVRRLEAARRARQWGLLLRDLHDGIGSISANISMLADVGQKTPTDEGKRAVLAQIAELANESNIEVRTMMNALETSPLSWPALCAEIRRFASAMLEPRGVCFELTHHGLPDSAPGLSAGNSLFRIIKESVANAAKHAQPTRVEAKLQCDGTTLELSISDDGRWIEPVRPGRGLRNIRNRVQELDGTFTLETVPATRLCCRIPVTSLTDEPCAQTDKEGADLP
jgi:signal transduction histidine kinase